MKLATLSVPGTLDDLLGIAEQERQVAGKKLNGSASRSLLGQYLTPQSVSSLMASMFVCRRKRVRILDPGAGTGSLTLALVARLLARAKPPESIETVAYEIDAMLAEHLERSLRECEHFCRQHNVRLKFQIRHEDFIAACCSESATLFPRQRAQYDCVILNPPYRKIQSDSGERILLRAAAIETANLYSAFMLLSARQLAVGGEFVAITPRSFCNGPYFKSFRQEFLQLLALRRLHLFDSRTEAFCDDNVLQENLITNGVRTTRPIPNVTVSCTTATGKLVTNKFPMSKVVRPRDSESIIHIAATRADHDFAFGLEKLHSSLETLGICVSTGRVVDFRARQHLRPLPGRNDAPLIHPYHLKHGGVDWPNGGSRKPNAIINCRQTADLLVPRGFYVLVKRFSAKEEKRRIVAAMYDPDRMTAEWIGFENKINYFHDSGNGLTQGLARGLTAYLNSTIVDSYFRIFSGHTQVNAADLRRLPYPSKQQLIDLGHRAGSDNQLHIDSAVGAMIYSMQ